MELTLGGLVLHAGGIAEMVTGEGKTLVATLPAYLNALEGKGMHVRKTTAWPISPHCYSPILLKTHKLCRSR